MPHYNTPPYNYSTWNYSYMKTIPIWEPFLCDVAHIRIARIDLVMLTTQTLPAIHNLLFYVEQCPH
jgi:hypothetical protein